MRAMTAGGSEGRWAHEAVARGVGAAVLAAGLLLAGAAPAAASVLSWSAPTRVDHQPPFASSIGLHGVSCANISLCVATDGGGGAAI